MHSPPIFLHRRDVSSPSLTPPSETLCVTYVPTARRFFAKYITRREEGATLAEQGLLHRGGGTRTDTGARPFGRPATSAAALRPFSGAKGDRGRAPHGA